MCTVSFLPTQRGYHLAMNRDEQRDRPQACPPRWQGAGLYPFEKSTGGTWIALNKVGISLALINWYAQSYRPPEPPTTRGLLIPALIPHENLSSVHEHLAQWNLSVFPAFRLLAVDPHQRQVREWQWDGETLQRRSYPWRCQHWFSSGYDEPGAQRARAQVCQQARRQLTFGSLAWLRRLHRSHLPKKGAYSICMHRADAVTVSYTEISVSSTQGRMRYVGGAPCQNKAKLFSASRRLGG